MLFEAVEKNITISSNTMGLKNVISLNEIRFRCLLFYSILFIYLFF